MNEQLVEKADTPPSWRDDMLGRVVARVAFEARVDLANPMLAARLANGSFG